MELPKIVVIVGTNASGKSSLGVDLAELFSGEVISADSRQVYRGFDLCCGKISESEKRGIVHHLINIRDIGEPFSSYEFQNETYYLIPQIKNRGKLPIIVGGSVAYIMAVTEGFVFNGEVNHVIPSARNETKAEKKNMRVETIQSILETVLSYEELEYAKRNLSDWNNPRRLNRYLEKNMNGFSIIPQRSPKVNPLIIGITWPKEILYKRIDDRLALRIEQGMLDEVRTYLANGGNEQFIYDLGLEYRFILEYLNGKYNSFDEFRKNLSIAIKQFAKRQIKYLKPHKEIKWIDMCSDYFTEVTSLVSDFLSS